MFCYRLLTSSKFNIFFKKKSGTVSKCQTGWKTGWIQIRTEIVAVLIWVQTDCKCYQLTTKVAAGKERVKIINEVCKMRNM